MGSSIEMGNVSVTTSRSPTQHQHQSPNPVPNQRSTRSNRSNQPPAESQWRLKTGRWREWQWRGWRVKYTYLPGPAGRDHPKRKRPPIVAIHGFGASIGHWRHNLEVWAESGPVYALDLVGFGGSEKPATDYSGTLWVSQLTAFLDTIVREPAILIGNSIGSAIALTVAHQSQRTGNLTSNRNRVVGAIALSLPDTSARADMIPAPLLPIVSFLERAIANPPLLKTIFYWVRQPKVIRNWVGIAYPNKQAVDDDLVEILSEPPQDSGSADAFVRILRGMSSPTFTPPMKPILAASQIPILILWGSQDRMIPPSLAKGFAGLNPQVTVRSLDGLGHCPHDEAPDHLNPLILDWIAHTQFPQP